MTVELTPAEHHYGGCNVWTRYDGGWEWSWWTTQYAQSIPQPETSTQQQSQQQPQQQHTAPLSTCYV